MTILWRQVRLWQCVFVGSETERVIDLETGIAGWAIPSYTMVPDQAAVVFWHKSGRGYLCAQSAWEVIQEAGISNEDGRMPILAKPRKTLTL